MLACRIKIAIREVIFMSIIKAEKQGNVITVTIPTALGLKEDEEFFIFRNDNGAITLIPKEENHFKHAGNASYYMPELNVGYRPDEKSI